jgi:heat shock protein HslJ
MKISTFFMFLFSTLLLLAGCSIGHSVDQNFVESEWHLVQLNGHDVMPTLHEEITMTITDEGIEGYGGCNYFSNDGKFFMRSGEVSIKGIVSGAKSCGTEINDQENVFYHALITANTYRISGNRLELYDDNNQLVLLFERGNMQ